MAPSRRLDSWKEIAEYLGRDVRTALRWEHDRCLPVHRVPGGRRGGVFALTDEIDAWLLATLENGDSRDRGAARELPSPPPTLVPVEAAPPPPLVGSPGRVLASAGLLALGVCLGLAVLLLFRRPDGASADRGVVAAFALKGTELIACDAERRVLWRHDFGRRVVEREDPRLPGLFSIRLVRSPHGESTASLIVSVTFASAPPSAAAYGELFAFDAGGRPLWSFRSRDTLTFGAGRFSPPWISSHTPAFPGPEVAVFTTRGRPRIAWAQSHHTWWPSILSVLDESGKRVSTWVHSGCIYSVTAVSTPRGPRLLAAGTSNSRAAGFFAVLDAEHVDGAGPEEPSSRFDCHSCGPGRPLRYLVVEPSELTRASSPYNALFDVRPDEAGVEVRTNDGSPLGPVGQAILRLSPDLAVETADWSSGWDFGHRELERAGKLDHSLDRCPVRNAPPRVREWTPEGGWRPFVPAPIRFASTASAEHRP